MRKMIVSSLLAWIAMAGPGASSSYSKTPAIPASWKSLYKAVHSKPQVVRMKTGKVQTSSYSGSKLTVAAMTMMRGQNPRLFDRMFPALGKVVMADTQIRMAMAQGVKPTNGLLPNTALYNYLQYRRDLNPARFDYYHPVLGPILAENQQIQDQTNPTPLPGEIVPPPSPGNGDTGGDHGGGGGNGGGDNGGGGTPSPTPPGGDNPLPPPIDVHPPPAVPEPGSIVLILAGAGLLGVTRRRALRRAQGRSAD